MSDVAIEVQGLGKRYTLGGNRKPYKTLRESFTDTLFRRTAKVDADRVFWALKDVSFTVNRGEVVGIIGRNGAGKSTLLKVLSRITEPTEGQIAINGLVGSLLEVGTGFHPELTGRENIYLNGAILGMRRADISKKFDEIVAFAETEKFLDTPVKFYSSGMYTRLAFAVAAHLEPDILIVDEVLAVGDVAFQRKCMGKMGEVANAGRTVLFVSHNMQAMARLCSRCVLLKNGQVAGTGDSARMIAAHLSTGTHSSAERRWDSIQTAPGGDVVRLARVRMCDADGNTIDDLDVRRPISLEMTYDVLRSGQLLVPNINIANAEGVIVFAAIDNDPAWRNRRRPEGRYTSLATIPGNLLAEGTYNVSVAVSTMDPLTIHAVEVDAVTFQVVDPMEGDSARGDFTLPMPGVICPMLKWETRDGGAGMLELPGSRGDAA